MPLPLDLASPRARLAQIRRSTAAFKRDGRPAGREAVLGALGMLPDPLRGVAARAVASPRLFNLTISNVPGPDFPLYMLGAELIEAHPVVPIAQGHALSIGIFSYLGRLHFGFYADPHAFPEVTACPAPSRLHSESYSSLRECRGGGAGREAAGPSPRPPKRDWLQLVPANSPRRRPCRG